MRVPVVSLLLSSALARPAITSSSDSFSVEPLEFVTHEKTLSGSPSTSDVDSTEAPVVHVDLVAPPTLADNDDDALDLANALEQIIEKAKADVASLKEQKEELLAMIAEQEERLKQLWNTVQDQAQDDYPVMVDVSDDFYPKDTFQVDEESILSEATVNVIVILVGCTLTFLLVISLVGLWVLSRVLSARRRRHSSRRDDKIGHRHRRCPAGSRPGRRLQHGREQQTLPQFQRDAQQQWLQRQDKALLSEKSTLVAEFVYTDEKRSNIESDRDTSIDEDLAGLRAIVEVVGDMVTAEEGHQAASDHAHADDLPRYETTHPGRPPSYKEQVSDDEETR